MLLKLILIIAFSFLAWSYEKEDEKNKKITELLATASIYVCKTFSEKIAFIRDVQFDCKVIKEKNLDLSVLCSL